MTGGPYLFQLDNGTQEIEAASDYPSVRIFSVFPAKSDRLWYDLRGVEIDWSIPDNGEQVHFTEIDGLIALCSMCLLWQSPWQETAVISAPSSLRSAGCLAVSCRESCNIQSAWLWLLTRRASCRIGRQPWWPKLVVFPILTGIFTLVSLAKTSSQANQLMHCLSEVIWHWVSVCVWRISSMPMLIKKMWKLPSPFSTARLWNAMINPLLDLSIYGLIWYQGNDESRSHNVPIHKPPISPSCEWHSSLSPQQVRQMLQRCLLTTTAH